jgi:hypothetical protein
MRDQCRELAVRVGRDPDELVEWWAERAAIREIDGGLPRAEAERAAFEDLRASLDATSIVGDERRGPRAAASTAVPAGKREEK